MSSIRSWRPSPRSPIPRPRTRLSTPRAFDTNGDGRADLIAAVQGTNGASNQIRYFSTAGASLGLLNGFVGPWNIASLTNPDPNLPAPLAAADQVFSLLGAEESTKKSKKKSKKK